MKITQDKSSIRKRIRRQRANLDNNTFKQKSQAMCQHLLHLNAFKQAQHIATYQPLGHEIDPSFIINTATKQNKQLYLSVISKTNENVMQYYPYDPHQTLTKNRYGIMEPNTDDQVIIEPTLLDFIIIPLVAFDAQCNRLGQGAGFFDRYLAQYKTSIKKPTLVGVGYEFQKVAQIPTDSWDIQLDYIVTEESVYTRA